MLISVINKMENISLEMINITLKNLEFLNIQNCDIFIATGGYMKQQAMKFRIIFNNNFNCNFTVLCNALWEIALEVCKNNSTF